jgi:hypothetical protein
MSLVPDSPGIERGKAQDLQFGVRRQSVAATALWIECVRTRSDSDEIKDKVA